MCSYSQIQYYTYIFTCRLFLYTFTKLLESYFKSLNILINTAQEVPLGNLLNVSDESFLDGWNSGPLATFRFMKGCYPHLKGDGKILNLASSSALRPDSASYGAYAAVKEAIRSLSRAAAVEWGSDNILVNCISPGGIEDNQPKKFKLRYKRSCNSKGLLSGNDVANAALFLISKESQFINGQNIIVDDGWSL